MISAAPGQLHVQQELAIGDLGDIVRARAERSVPPSPAIVFAGRLVHWKGADLALAAFARYRAHSGAGRLLICGEGPERAKLEALARGLGIADVVEFRGKLAQDELFALFRRSSVFLFPSLHDAGGTVVLEALAERLAGDLPRLRRPEMLRRRAVRPRRGDDRPTQERRHRRARRGVGSAARLARGADAGIGAVLSPRGGL